jgi:hypothetical protein
MSLVGRAARETVGAEGHLAAVGRGQAGARQIRTFGGSVLWRSSWSVPVL